MAGSSTGSSRAPFRGDRPAGSGESAAAECRPGRVLPDDGERSPASNLAHEEALAACHSGAPVLRLWRNDRCVVVGRAQLVEAEVDVAACRELGIPILRRFTGGGTVFQDPGNLNVSLTAARDDAAVRAALARGLAGLYELVLGPLTAAVCGLGGAASHDERAVWLGEGKISGVAAWLGSRTVLVHATLLADSDLHLLARSLAGPGAPGNSRWEHTKSRRVRVTSLAREGLATDPATVDAAVRAAFGSGEDSAGPGGATGFTAGELAAAGRLLRARYSRPEWHIEGRSGS